MLKHAWRLSKQKDLTQFFEYRLAAAEPDFCERISQARATETLPIMPIMPEHGNRDFPLALTACSSAIEVFLKTKALLRRERLIALRSRRRIGQYVLDESEFRMSFKGKSASLSKTDLCILGPFFDVKEATLDRRSLRCLAFAESGWKRGSRSIAAQVSRVRRNVKAQIGIDPLRSIRGIGYALATASIRRAESAKACRF